MSTRNLDKVSTKIHLRDRRDEMDKYVQQVGGEGATVHFGGGGADVFYP